MTQDQSRRPGDSPADLAELKATDALLDRIGTGTLSPQDRHDPLVAAFAQLRTALDEPADDAGLDVARLIEVLGERPLYLVDGDEAADASEADRPIPLGAPERPAARVIDVRDEPARVVPGAHRESPSRLPAPAAQVAARVADATNAAYGATVRSINSLTAGRRAGHGRLADGVTGWQAVAEKVALPAAAAVLLLGVGSGVSAAITGDPMAPVAGVSRVVGQLPGIETDASRAADVQASIVKAGELASASPSAAQQLLNQTRGQVQDLPEAKQSPLQEKIGEVQEKIRKAAPTDTPKATTSATTKPSDPVTSPSASATSQVPVPPSTTNSPPDTTSVDTPTGSATANP